MFLKDESIPTLVVLCKSLIIHKTLSSSRKKEIYNHDGSIHHVDLKAVIKCLATFSSTAFCTLLNLAW